MIVAPGQEARLEWKFATNSNVTFYGIVWTIFDRVFKNYTKLIWMDRQEILYRHFHTKDRRDYDVKFTSASMKSGEVVLLTIIIPNVQKVHENVYVCHVIRSNIRPSQVELKVKGEHLTFT